ncbi:MAG: hypothetical protein ACD_62C00377G0001 [uncultured bacterium]|nr:MAG: hypothetical protein ACD_62C00377G0001 [uncultured bacterium]HLD44221.1 ATP-binding protein [bacterium]
MEYKRSLNLLSLLENKSFFLFGPRSTGKTWLIKQQLQGKAIIIGLLTSDNLIRLTQNPGEIKDIILAHPEKKLVVIDEIQKIPSLLSEVHQLLDTSDLRFLLTGSSARKLKKGNADMLAGRAWNASLFPLTFLEIDEFDLEHYLRWGGLPQVYPSRKPDEELSAYVETYLREEILAEGLIRKLPPFSRFLKTAALSNGQLINFTELGNDAAVSPSTVREYFNVLTDTLIGFQLEPWLSSKKRKAIQTAKFYFFDLGVTHALANTKNLERNSNLYGASFEQFIGLELRAYLSYSRIKENLTFWRSINGQEVDFLIGEKVAIEVKATNRITSSDTKGLRTLAEEGVFKKYYLVSQDETIMKKDFIECLHWKEFLNRLWSGNGLE